MKWCAIIIDKHGTYEFAPRVGEQLKTYNIRKLRNIREVSKPHRKVSKPHRTIAQRPAPTTHTHTHTHKNEHPATTTKKPPKNPERATPHQSQHHTPRDRPQPHTQPGPDPTRRPETGAPSEARRLLEKIRYASTPPKKDFPAGVFW